MVSDNNKIKSLASQPDDETTTELEALANTFHPSADYDEELEADANTFEFEDRAAGSVADGQSISVLRADLISRTESVNRLQYDIEQLRLRWTGLEKEIQAREQLTANVNEDLRKTRRKLAKARKALRRSEDENRSTVEALTSKDGELHEAAERIDQLGKAVEEKSADADSTQARYDESQQRIEDLEQRLSREAADQAKSEERDLSRQAKVRELNERLVEARTSVAELEHYVDARKVEWHQQQQTLSDNSTELTETKREIERLNNELARQADALTDEQAAGGKLKEDLKTRKDDLRRLRRDNRELRQTLQNDTARQIDKARDRLDRQSGRLTANEHEIKCLREQLGRSERYADELREKLQKQTNIASHAVIAQEHLQMSLDEAVGRAKELDGKLAEERRLTDEQKTESASMQEQFDQQVRQVRLELDAAQQTISDHETINEQLTSDLIDNQGFRQALEQQLSSTEEDTGKSIRDLKRKQKRLEDRNEELKEKLGNKDGAIAALLSELATRSRTIESLGEMETVIHEIDGRMSERIDDETGVERERTARLLIGRVDGQELRFPLFKDRLTVGRSAHNDIQLNAQFVSRRHAVVVTEGDDTKIVDWGSKNGVFVNELRVAEQRLENGDIVTIGMADFKYQERNKR